MRVMTGCKDSVAVCENAQRIERGGRVCLSNVEGRETLGTKLQESRK